ncbi:MAG: hypothetical protein IPM08_06320 [Actinomycetales bacterium]|nr:hypothetical protein [Actinomycetales bacterium]
MKFLNELIVVLHLLGMAAIVGGWFAVRHDRRIISSIVWGARAQVITGLFLAGIASMDKDDPPNTMKIGVKLGVALAVLGLSEVANVRQRRAAAAAPVAGAPSAAATASVGSLVDGVFWLTVLNVAIAALWRSYS